MKKNEMQRSIENRERDGGVRCFKSDGASDGSTRLHQTLNLNVTPLRECERWDVSGGECGTSRHRCCEVCDFWNLGIQQQQPTNTASDQKAYGRG